MEDRRGAKLLQINANNDIPVVDRQLSEVVIKFSSQVEDIIAWLIRKEEELQKQKDENLLRNESLDHLLIEYSQHDKFMVELCEYCHTIMRCKEEGQELRDSEELTDEDRDEVDIQMDAMLVLYDKLNILTTDRLSYLQLMIDERQRSKIETLERLLDSIQSRLAASDNIGPDFDAVQRQRDEFQKLEEELQCKQDCLNSISRLILFDDVNPTSQLLCRSMQLEGRLKEINSRWMAICKLVNERQERLRKANTIWQILELEGPHLTNWLSKLQHRLNELSDAIRTDLKTEELFLSRLLARSDKLEAEIKSKQSFYCSLENRVRSQINEYDDPCSMFVIELEKKLEDIQDIWNSVMRQKRMIDFSLQALLNTDNGSPLPINSRITSESNFNLIRDMHKGADIGLKSNNQEPLNEFGNNSYSTGQDDLDSNPNFNDSLSDTRAFENSSSSQDTRSLACTNTSNNHLQYHTSTHDNGSHEELSSATNLSQHGNLYSTQNGNADYSFNRLDELDITNEYIDLKHEHKHDETHSCRVEEWKHSLESFSSWLRQVEISLGIIDLSQEINDLSKAHTWSKLSLQAQSTLAQDIEMRINSTCQDEFDCLFLQGQQIIEDLMPEIGENEYEANLKEILADIEIRYSAVKRCLIDKKRELADKERWHRLSNNLQDTCQSLITQMGEVIPDSDIGIDMITLAQQQDQLMHFKEELKTNSALNSCLKQSQSFLKLYDQLHQQYGQSQNQKQHSPSTSPSVTVQNQKMSNFVDIWLSFKEFKDEIENHLDRLTLHHSELSQLIEDRLTRLDEVHKEMHALQYCIQDLATRLQVAEILKSNWVPLENLSIEQLSEQLEDLKMFRERLAQAESVHKEMNSIVVWMEQSNTPLSQANLKRIDELNDIWNLIQEAVDERQKSIEHAFDEQSGSEQKFLAQTVADLPSWERRVATSKVPYFINHESNKTLWDHPKFTNILESMDICKHYVFSAYRTAMKLRIVQKSLGIDKLMLEQLKEILIRFDYDLSTQRVAEQNSDSHSMQTNSNSYNAFYNVEQIILLLKIIFEKLQSSESSSLDVPVAIDLTLNWLLNLYDSTRTGQVSAQSLKVGLALLCCATREEKYIYMFELIANFNSGTVDAKKLGGLFEICMRIPTYLGENESFGGQELIGTSIRNCFAISKFNPQHPNCIDLSDYLNWLKTEPQFIIWLDVLHRLLLSENTVHLHKCKLCGTNPIIGLRYRCLKCFKFNMCQKCFLTGRHVQEHYDPLKHPMQEYRCKTNFGDQVRDFSRILRSAFI